jgi:hypothetical protein
MIEKSNSPESRQDGSPLKLKFQDLSAVLMADDEEDEEDKD